MAAGAGDDDDSMVLNTMNQTEMKQTLTDRKTKINGKTKVLKKDKTTKKLLKGQKSDGNRNKDVKKKLATNGSSNLIDSAAVPDVESDIREEAMSEVPRREWNNPGQTNSSKNAKFSSLFKNNHEIPKIGE